jgi:polysaccharide biosynthesis/export protein VpsN
MPSSIGKALLLTVTLLIPAGPIPRSAAAQSSPDAVSPATTTPLRPGDVVRLFFWRDPALNGEYAVDENGSVALPYLGYREIGQIPAGELKQLLAEEYREYLSDQAVQITMQRRITILGAVHSPGIYHVDPTMSIRDALALAGGVAPQGELSGLEVRRGGRAVAIDEQSGLVAGALASGDQLFVPERGWFDRNGAAVLGAVISALGFIVGQALF